MILTLTLAAVMLQKPTKPDDDDWYVGKGTGMEVYDGTFKCDWSGRYVSTAGPATAAIRLMGSGRNYVITGFSTGLANASQPLVGKFEQKPGMARGWIKLFGIERQSWVGEWNRRLGCFELSGTAGPKHLQLWWEQRRMAFRFLEGHKPLAKPHDVPDHLMGIPTEIQASYGFRANFASIVKLADQELLAAHWEKSLWRDGPDDKGRLFTCYYEPGPSGRSVAIEPNTAFPDQNFASDLISSATLRNGWVGISISGPKRHG